MASRRVTVRIEPPTPFGEVIMVPEGLSGRPRSDIAKAMAAALGGTDMPTAADVYRQLRQSFPNAPLSARVGALGVIMERLRRSF